MLKQQFRLFYDIRTEFTSVKHNLDADYTKFQHEKSLMSIQKNSLDSVLDSTMKEIQYNSQEILMPQPTKSSIHLTNTEEKKDVGSAEQGK